ncbi:hypothetical protein BV25DRAFT_1468714 [Artomyces pyxidatus]|uniref:Uncharacterized protein n=1 Tax=Artomyces pyxidatus TaxID=48021 RepID=A0ACB8SKH2_9AGAM|nr:hypothetical protein BV25DRAFT_1468714 [Artomyces pyxidatus]
MELLELPVGFKELPWYSRVVSVTDLREEHAVLPVAGSILVLLLPGWLIVFEFIFSSLVLLRLFGGRFRWHWVKRVQVYVCGCSG